MAADFVNSIDVLNLAVRRVKSLHRLIARGADRFRDTLVHRVVRLIRQYFLPVVSKISSLNGTPRSCWSSSNNQGISWSSGPFGAGDVWTKAALASRIAANHGMNLILSDSKWMRYSQQDQTPWWVSCLAGNF